MKLGQALMLAASAAAAAGAAVYAKKKFDSKGAKKEEDKASRWKSLPQDAEVVIPKKKPVHSAAVKEEVTETTPCENEIVSQLARDIEIVSAEEEPEVQPTANEEASVQQETSEVAVAEQTEEKPALQKKQKQKKYYAPVDFTFTEEENEAPVSFENVMEHFKEVELTEEEKQYYVPATEDAREEADAESYAEIEEDEKTIFESFLDEPVVEKEEEIPDTEEEEVIQDANEQQAFQDFAHAVAPVPLVVNEVTAIPESEAERITSESAQIPSIDGIPSLSAEEETPAVIEEIIQMPEATEEAVEEVAEAPIIEEVVAPVIEEVAEAPVIEEVAEAPVIEEVVAPVIEEVAEAPVIEEVADTPVIEEVAEAPIIEEVAEAPVIEEVAEAPVIEEVVAPIIEEVAEAPVIEEVVAPVIEEVVEAPIIEEVAETPVIEEVAEAPVVEEVAEAPIVEEIVAPVIEEVAEAPVIEEVAEAPVIEEVAEAPIVEEIVAPIIEEVAEVPVIEEVAEAPIIEEVAEAPVIEEVAEAPVIEEVAEAPVIEEVAEAPVIEEVAETPAIEEVAEAPVIEEVAEAPIVEEVAEAPVIEEVAEAPIIEEVVEAPVIEEVAEAPVTQEVAEAPVIEEVVEAPVIEEVAEAPVIEEVVEAPVIEEVVAPIIEEVAGAPVIEEVVEAPVIEEVAEAPVIEEVAEAPVTEEVIKIAEPAPFVEADMGISLPDMDEESDGSHAAIDPMKEAMINADFGDLLTDIAVAPDAPKKTLDFFDNPEEEELRHTVSDDEVSMEDLFGDLLAETDAKPEPAITSPSEVFNMFDTGSVDEDDFDDYKDEKIEKAQEMISTSDTRRAIAQDIADNIDLFAQLLEPLNAIKENKVRVKSGILFDWEMRIQSLIGDPPIKSYWRNNFANYEIWTDEKYMEKADELLSMLQLVGIVRDNVKEVVINRETMEFYSAQSEQMNNDFNIGETAVVVRPCWKINGRPARKGEITKKAPFADFSSKNVSPLEQMLRANKCDDGDVNIPVSEDNFCSFDKDVPYIKQAISSGVCKCAVRRMEGGTALAFFYEVISDGDSQHYDACTLRFEATIDKNCKIVGRFRGEKV